MNNQYSILIVDDEESICQLCHSSLSTEYPRIRWTTNPVKCLEMITADEFDLLITDIKMPAITGLELMHKAREIDPQIQVIIMTAFATIETAIQAVREGAGNFIHKPFHVQEFKLAVQSLLEKERLRKENFRLRSIVNLMQTSEKIATIHDPVKLQEVVLQAAIRETGASTGKIYHIDPETHEPTLFMEAQMRRSQLEHEKSRSKIDLWAGETGKSQICIPLVSNAEEKRHLELLTDETAGFSKADVDSATILASQFAVALDNSELLNEMEDLFLNTIKTLAFTLEEKDPKTCGHSQRVAKISREIGQRLHLDKTQLSYLEIAGNLHDIGKIGIPDKLLQKPGKLTAAEFRVLQTHPEKGAKILTPIQRLQPMIDAVKSHHERFDGTGYPAGLRGEEIPLLGAIVSAADALDTITTDRPYRKGRTITVAYEILAANKGKQFHPEVVEAILSTPLTELGRSKI